MKKKPEILTLAITKKYLQRRRSSLQLDLVYPNPEQPGNPRYPTQNW